MARKSSKLGILSKSDNNDENDNNEEEVVLAQKPTPIVKQPLPKKASKKLPTSFRLDEDLLFRLEGSYFELRKITRTRGYEISRAKMVEYALAQIMDDLDENGIDSDVARHFLSIRSA